MAAALTRRLTASTSAADAVAATREALALGGLSTWDGQQFLAEAAAPAASGFVMPEETVALAMEARQRPTAGHLTLAQLGDMLQDFGWPFAEGSAAGEELREVFQAWVSDALAQPEAPLSFTPLFLREMAQTQQPAIDLAQGDYDPEQLHLTLLELELFAAHFDRICGAAAETSWNKVPGLAMPAAQTNEPCSDARKWLESQANDAGQAAIGAGRALGSYGVVGPALREALQVAGLSEAAARRFGQALTALSIASKIWKLAALYCFADVEVTAVGANPVHAPLPSESELYHGFQARAGITDHDWREYQASWNSSDVWRGVRDCFGTYGLPVMPDLGDMAKEIKDWKVEWRLEGAPEFVRIYMDDNTWYHPGILRMKLQPDGEHSAAATLFTRILPQKAETRSGPEKQARAMASAALHTAKPPSAMTWANAIRGGLGNVLALANAVTELSAGWIAEMVPPKAYTNLTVLYYEGGGEGWSGRITYTKTKAVDETENGTNVGGYAFTHHTYENSSQTSTVDVSSGKLRASTALEEIWDLSGDATVIFQEEQLTEHSYGDNGCKGSDVATSHERSHSSMSASGNGEVAGDLILNNDGTYQLNFGSLPEAQGEVESQYDYWWDNKPCVEDEKHDQYTEPQSASAHEIFIEGKVDPKNPGVISGQYDLEEFGGYKITVTWNLKQAS